MDSLEQAVKDALAALYRVEVASKEQTYAQEVAYAVPVSYLVRLAELTGATLPESLRHFAAHEGEKK